MPVLTDKCNSIMNDIVIQEDKVLKHLKEINCNKSMGPDGIHPILLKEAAEQLVSTALHYIQEITR